MGRLEAGQGQLFYDLCLEKLVPADHLVRRIDAVLDLSWLRDEMAPYYSHTGRPSIDPELMLRMLIVGYVFAIRSERQLCSELQVNMAYRWFCGLSIESAIPDHSVFSRARHERFREADVLRRVFERVVGTCIVEGLVGGDAFSIDASLIKADVNPTKRVPGDQPIAWPERGRASRAVREYLSALDQESEDAGPVAGGGKRKPRMAISLTDPQAAWVAYRKVRSIFAYHANYLIDNKLGVIIDAEGNRANRIDENRAAITMVERVAQRFALKPKRLAADTAYGNARTLKSLVEHGIEPHIPVIDKSARPDGLFSRADFQYRPGRDVYICPGGKELKTSGTAHEGTTLKYVAKRRDCGGCPVKPKCTKGRARRLSRDIDQPIRDYVHALAGTPGFRRSRDERKKVEMAFAHMKRIFKLDRFRLRGLSGARDEVLLTATAQNLRKLARYAGPSPPNRAVGCAA
jgi:transposase